MSTVVKQTKAERAAARNRAETAQDAELARIANMAAQAAQDEAAKQAKPDKYDLWCAGYADQGVTGLALLVQALHDVLGHRNSTGLCKLVGKGTKNLQVNARIRSIAGKAIGGITVKADKSHFTGVKVLYGDNHGPTELLGQLDTLVQRGASLFGKEVGKLLTAEKVKKPIDEIADLIAARILKLCKDEKVSVESFLTQNLTKAINLANI